MQFMSELLIAILLSYLSFTNFLATQITHLLGEEVPESGVVIIENEDNEPADQEPVVEAATPRTLTPLTSIFSVIPDVLRQNAAYQQATALSGLPSEQFTTDPYAAIVNIYCTFTTASTIRTTTGTGFFVHDQGIILTNAHVAQFLLLAKTDALGDSECLVRDGSPASPRYRAELLYIPPAWITEHAALIDAANPTGTGERDYALLYITEAVDASLLPATFPALMLDTTTPTEATINGTMTVAGYPAGALTGSTATTLLARTATTSISELFTFGTRTVDVVALRGSQIGEQGASGGPVINEQGRVIGMVTTRGNDEVDGVGSLRAITIDHINRTIREETTAPLLAHLDGRAREQASIFTSTMLPFLTNLLTIEIDGE